MPDLYMVELTVSDWPTAVAWYRDTLGLAVVLLDESNRFALLGAGSGRLALKQGMAVPGTVSIAFAVYDLPAELDRLARCGVTLEEPLKVSPEGYRRALLRDRDGYHLCLFDWKGRE